MSKRLKFRWTCLAILSSALVLLVAGNWKDDLTFWSGILAGIGVGAAATYRYFDIEITPQQPASTPD